MAAATQHQPGDHSGRPPVDLLSPFVRVADLWLSWRPVRYFTLTCIQPFVVLTYLYERITPKRELGSGPDKRRASLSPTERRGSLTAATGVSGEPLPTPPPSSTASTSSLDVRHGEESRSHRNVSAAVRPKFHRNSTFSDGGSETSGSIYSTASAAPAYLPKINKYAIIRTSDASFEPIKELFPFQPKYFKLGSLRIHYIDEGTRESSSPPGGATKQKVVVLVHGALTWMYMYRKVIRQLVDAGLRVIAIDLPGHGKSDKIPMSGAALIQIQVAAIRSLLNRFSNPDLDVTLVAHGTGGTVVGIALAEMGDFGSNLSRLVFVNTFLPPHQEECSGREIETLLIARSLFYTFRTFVKPSTMIRCATAFSSSSRLTIGEARGYDVPYPTVSHAHAVKTLPSALPLPLFSDPLILRIRELFPFFAHRTPLISPLLANNQSVEVETEKAKLFLTDYARRVARRWVDGKLVVTTPTTSGANHRALVIWGTRDRCWSGLGKWFANLMGARLVTIDSAGHYVPEDDPEALAQCLLEFIQP
ncbi:Alpha/Beta hydrolase protein [Fimicolochytrium jonesii]|uniref:Alpha/Beta hydrolase protein n=1 Tax=Fimicolochytrium jonesii TaxID=1396493 RepID=UPI0022FEF7FA|nr:Alpha/Beta hydrolase protein [Fimicolochytrium jonesii]KAI8821642.1 Alpha/Beta hydrolase protein [Fimicolochytrium jonesii]